MCKKVARHPRNTKNRQRANSRTRQFKISQVMPEGTVSNKVINSCHKQSVRHQHQRLDTRIGLWHMPIICENNQKISAGTAEPRTAGSLLAFAPVLPVPPLRVSSKLPFPSPFHYLQPSMYLALTVFALLFIIKLIISPYNPRASAKISIKIIATKILSCLP